TEPPTTHGLRHERANKPRRAREPSNGCSNRKRGCRWENGDSSYGCCTRYSFWQREKKSAMPLWKRAIARLVRLLRCSEKRWEQRHGDTLRIARDGLKARSLLVA